MMLWIGLLLGSGSGCDLSAQSERDIKLAETHYLLGADYLKNKKPFMAKQELLKSLRFDSDNSDAYHLLGVISFMEGIHKTDLIDRIQCLPPSDAKEQRRVADEDFRRGEQYLKNVVKLAKEDNKTESTTLVYLANIAFHFKRYDEAIKLCNEAMKNSYYASRQLTHGIIGWAYFHLGKLEKAGHALRQAVFHEPKFCVGRYRLAKVYFGQKNYNRAIFELKQIIDDKNCPLQEVPYVMGLAYIKKRELEQARKNFEACVTRNPNSCLAKTCSRLAKGATRSTSGSGK